MTMSVSAIGRLMPLSGLVLALSAAPVAGGEAEPRVWMCRKDPWELGRKPGQWRFGKASCVTVASIKIGNLELLFVVLLFVTLTGTGTTRNGRTRNSCSRGD